MNYVEARFQNDKDKVVNGRNEYASRMNHLRMNIEPAAEARVQNLYIPQEFVATHPGHNNDWFEVQEVSFSIETATGFASDHTYTANWATLVADGLVKNPGFDARYPNCYVVDIESYVRNYASGHPLEIPRYQQVSTVHNTLAAPLSNSNIKTAGAGVSATNTINGYLGNADVDVSYAKARVSKISVTYDSPNAHILWPERMLQSDEYLSYDHSVAANGTVTKGSANGYSFAYSMVYVDRTYDDLTSAVETTTDAQKGSWGEYSTPTFGKQSGEFKFVTTKETLYTDNIETKDPNHNTMGNVKKVTAEQDVYHLLGSLEVRAVRGSKVDAVFAYDKSENDVMSPVSYNASSGAYKTNIPDGGIYAGDYVEYSLYVGADANSPIALEGVNGRFEVGEGQRIVGWQIERVQNAQGKWVEHSSCGYPVVARIGDNASGFNLGMRDAPACTESTKDSFGNENYSENRAIEFQVGSPKWENGTITLANTRAFQPGQGIYLRVITQMTSELGSAAYDSAEDVAFSADEPSYRYRRPRADWYAVSAPMHGYAQYRAKGTEGEKENVLPSQPNYSAQTGGTRSVWSDVADAGLLVDGSSNAFYGHLRREVMNRNQYAAYVFSVLTYYQNHSDWCARGFKPRRRSKAGTSVHSPKCLSEHGEGRCRWQPCATHRKRPSESNLPFGQCNSDG